MVSVTALNASNYPTWKVQCKMTLMKDDLWDIIEGVEESPNPQTDPGKYAKFKAGRTKHLHSLYYQWTHPRFTCLEIPKTQQLCGTNWRNRNNFSANHGSQERAEEEALFNEAE